MPPGRCASRPRRSTRRTILADQLREEGFDVSRTFRYVIVGAEDRQQAVELAQRVHGEVEPGGELVYEVQPANPFAVFGVSAPSAATAASKLVDAALRPVELGSMGRL